ncbi:MAG: bis(5'-nucleosyl)-tetraphosphatase (symmetrical) YqeK [Clostridia bacterium]|nr:bis(5'-nucleosyl)-tetraphosphatase (symmetrical) YqeK [Clostridia bacterium]
MRISALLHDITKEYDVKRQLQIFTEFGIIFDNVMLASPKVFHAHTAALLIPREFPEFADAEVISAVRKHTTGCADMSVMDMLIYLADYIEPTRKFADCKTLRSYFWEGIGICTTEQEKLLHLYKTMVLSFDLTMQNLIEEHSVIAPDTMAARNAFVLKCKSISEESK